MLEHEHPSGGTHNATQNTHRAAHADAPGEPPPGTRRHDRAVVRDALGVGIAVGLSGFAFGVTAAEAGLTTAQACAPSRLVFTGASQFAVVGALAAGAGPATAAAGAAFLGVRNAFHGLRLAPLLRLPPSIRPLAAHATIDETAAVALAQQTRRSARIGFTVTGVTVFTLWNLTTLLGALGAGALGDTTSWRPDAAGPAVFLALLAPMLRTGTARATAVPAAAAGLGLLPVLAARCRRTGGAAAATAQAPERGAGHRPPNRDAGRRRERPRTRPRRPACVCPAGGGAAMSTWTAVALTALGCYAAKLLGLSVPQGVLQHPFARRLVTLLPVALLAALTAQQTFGDGGELILDAKAAGLGAAVAALLLRAPSSWSSPPRCRSPRRYGRWAGPRETGGAVARRRVGSPSSGCSRGPGPLRRLDTGPMRLTDFWQRMADHFGASYADTFARDHVMSELGGRTVNEALRAGWGAKEIWRTVCDVMDVPAEKR